MTLRSLFHRLFHHNPKEIPVSLASELISDIENRFSFHPPTTDLVAQAHGKVRSILEAAAKEALSVAVDIAPWGAEAEHALKALDEAAMWLNAHIARNQTAPAAPEAPAEQPAPVEPAPAPEPAPVEAAPAPDPAPVAEPAPEAPADPAPVEAAPAEAPVSLAGVPGAPVPEAAPVDPAAPPA